MPSYLPDLIAYSGGRRILNFVAADVDTLITNLAAELAASSWTTLSSGTMTGHPFHDMLSVQSPYFDPSVVPPASYKAQVRVLIHADNPNTVKIKPSNWDGTLTLSVGDQELELTKDAVNSRRIISCGFQFVTYLPGSFATFGAVIVSAPHTPPFFQQTLALEECIVAFNADVFRQRLAQGGTVQQFFCVKHSGGTFKWSGGSNVEGHLEFLTPVGGRALFQTLPLTTGYWVYNKDDDPNMLTPALWYGLFVPPTMRWGRSTGNAGPVFNFAWLWDCLLCSQNYTGDVTYSFDGHTFANFQNGNDGGSVPGCLLFATGPTTGP